jgi:thymidylate synthase (FAD)
VGNFGTQSKSNKQMRDAGEITPEVEERDLRWQADQRLHMEAAFALYNKHMAEGMPRELARDSLPFATYSRMFGTVDLHNLFHFIGLRSHSHAQFEIRVYSDALLDLVEQICPHAVAAFREFRLEQAPPEPVKSRTVTAVMGKPHFHGDLGFLNKP